MNIIIILFSILEFFFYKNPKNAHADFAYPAFRDTFYTSSRGEAMGGTALALADDEQAIYKNPAGLAGLSGFHFNLATVDGVVSDDLLNKYSKLSSAVSSTKGIAAANDLMGMSYYARAQGTSSFRTAHLGIGIIYDYQGGLYFRNQVYPLTYFGFQNTYGAQIAFGVPIIKKNHKWELRFGMAGKALWRIGGYKDLTLAELLNLSLTKLTSDIQTSGAALGVDAGTQAIYHVTRYLSFLGGMSLLDIGNTTFSNGLSTQPSNFSIGTAVELQLKEIALKMAYEQSRLFETLDWQLKTHFGVEIKIPILSLYAGLNQFQITYGLAVNFWILHLMYASTSRELTDTYNQAPEGRTLFQLRAAFEF